MELKRLLTMISSNMIELTIPTELLNEFIELANNGQKTIMKDLSIIEEQNKIKELASRIVKNNSYHYGNIFSHTEPFTIHSDISNVKQTILLIPIKAHYSQKFIVFDQTVNLNESISWIYNIYDDKTNQELKDMYYETAKRTRPYDTPEVVGCIDAPISDELFEHLPFSKDLYYGLTGKIWDYIPGKALLFNATALHATGRMVEPKIGCTIQFKKPIADLI